MSEKETTATKCETDPKTGNWAVTMGVAAPGMTQCLRVTSKKTGHAIYLPLPIRLIEQVPDAEGGGCIVRGAYGDTSTAKEGICKILDRLSWIPLDGASEWALAE